MMKASTTAFFTPSLLGFLLLVLSSAKLTNAASCDEAKCRAERIHPWVDNDTEYTCWVKPPTFEDEVTKNNATIVAEEMAAFEQALMNPASGYCADGFIARLVPDVPQREVDGEMRSWFTCCPPEEGFDDPQVQVYQTCVDVCGSPDWANGGNCWADGFQEPLVCANPQYRYPKYTGQKSLIYVQFLCCENPQVNDQFMDELFAARCIWLLLSSITVISGTVFVVALYRNKEVRSNGYNLYLIYLAIPDVLANIVILLRVALAMSAIAISPNVYIFAASFEYFYAISNMYLNAIIVGTIHWVLCESNKDRQAKIPPPSVEKVNKHTAIVYSFALVVFGWAFFLYINGLVAFSLDEIMNVWITTRCLLVGPPILYVVYVVFDVWIFDRLPIKGRTRVLALYFLRVIFVFLVTWVPYFVMYEVAWNVTHQEWMVYVSYYLGSIQGSLSVVVALSKPDVKMAFWDFVYELGTYFKKDPQDDVDKLSSHPANPALEGAVTADPEDSNASQRQLKHQESNVSTVSATKQTNRLFGKKTKADAMWEEDDLWGGEDDLIDRIMNGEIETEYDFDKVKANNAPETVPPQPQTTGSFSDDASNEEDNKEEVNV